MRHDIFTADELEEIKKELMEAAMTEARRGSFKYSDLQQLQVEWKVTRCSLLNQKLWETEKKQNEPIDDEVVSGLATSWICLICKENDND